MGVTSNSLMVQVLVKDPNLLTALYLAHLSPLSIQSGHIYVTYVTDNVRSLVATFICDGLFLFQSIS